MSDTPRTDAARLWHFDEPVVPLDFASQLERELVEMKRENLVRQRSELRQELTDANNRASFFELVRVALGAETQMQALEIANRLRTDVEDWRIAAADFATNPDGLRCELLEQERVIAEQLGLIGGYRSELKELTKQRDHFKAEMESWIGQNTDRVADCLRLGQERDAWRKCAEHLKDAVCTALNCGGQQGFERDFCKEALAAFEKLKGKE